VRESLRPLSGIRRTNPDAPHCRRAIGTLCLSVVVACGGSPTVPSSGSPLTVRVIDGGSNQLVSGDNVTVTLAGPSQRTGSASTGVVTFSAVVPGPYSVSVTGFGLKQSQPVNVDVPATTSVDVATSAVDDIGITSLTVDGQGTIQPGGTIDIPARGGVTIRFGGSWRSVTYPATPADAFAFVVQRFPAAELSQSETWSIGPSTWERILTGFVPCSGDVTAPIGCRTTSDTFGIALVHHNGSHTECHAGGCFQVFDDQILARKTVTWPLTFRLAPSCCSLTAHLSLLPWRVESPQREL